MYKVSGFLFPDNFSSSKKTSFLLDVLSFFNFHGDETLIAKRSSTSIMDFSFVSLSYMLFKYSAPFFIRG